MWLSLSKLQEKKKNSIIIKKMQNTEDVGLTED